MNESGSGLLVLGLIAAAWYGLHQHDRAEELQTKLEAAQSQIDDLKEKSADLEGKSDDLRQQMDRFATENWRDVVPDAQAAADEVENAEGDLKHTADEAEGSE